MSRWLKSVNTLLDQLDGQVGDAVLEGEEADREAALDAEEVGAEDAVGSSSIDAILSKRGLDVDGSDDDDEEDGDDDEDGSDVADDSGDDADSEDGGGADYSGGETTTTDGGEEEEVVEFGDVEAAPTTGGDDVPCSPADGSDGGAGGGATEEESGGGHPDLEEQQLLPPAVPDTSSSPSDADVGDEDSSTPQLDVASDEASESASASASSGRHRQRRTSAQAPPSSSSSTSSSTRKREAPPTEYAEETAALREQVRLAKESAREANRQVRKLRRHVLDLNSELESSESEVAAQRTELERAAARMERDRSRHAEEGRRRDEERAEAIKAMTSEHEAALKSMTSSHAEQMDEMRERLRRAEEARAKEGGDWQGELAEAVQREQDCIRKMLLVEDEKSTLASQVSTLQTQLGSVQSRLDSMTETCNTSTERERDAEDRLDAALSLHARQLSQRQAREAELERTVADLGAALVVARQREQNRLKGAAGRPSSVASEQGSGGEVGGDEATRVKLASAQEEIETLKAQLALERQHCATLHQELRDVSKEHSEEAAAALTKQRQHDRLVADLTSKVSSLEDSLREKEEAEKAAVGPSSDGSGKGPSDEEVAEMQKQVSSLSEQILRQQKKIDNTVSEKSALRSRLRAALARAEVAEKALASSSSSPNGDPSSPDGFDLESGASPRRRGGGAGVGVNVRRRGRGPNNSGGSIRAAMNLQHGRGGEQKEKIGNAIDVVDKWTVETGNFLRHNPLARGAFILYILVLHLWALALLVFHAHSFEEIHGDFGLGARGVDSQPKGLSALLHDSPPQLRGQSTQP